MVHWISFHACSIGVLKHLVNASIAPTKDFCVQQNHNVMANLSMSNAMTYKRIYLKKSRRLTARPTKPLNDHSGFFYGMIITQFLCQKKERHFYTSLSKSGINGTKKKQKKEVYNVCLHYQSRLIFLGTKYGTIWIYSYQKNCWQTKKYCRIDISDQMILALHQGQKKTICYPLQHYTLPPVP